MDKRELHKRLEEIRRKTLTPPTQKEIDGGRILLEKAKKNLEERKRDVKREIDAISKEGAEEIVWRVKGRISVCPGLSDKYAENYEKIKWR